MHTLRQTIVYSIFILTIQIFQDNYAAPALSTASKNVQDGLSEAGKTIAEALPNTGLEAAKKLAPMANIFVVAIAAGQAWSIGKDIVHGLSACRRYIYPWAQEKSADEQLAAASALQAQEVKRRTEFLVAESAFKNCLIQNKRSARNKAGLPSICEETTETFALVAGLAQINDIKMAFIENVKSEIN